MAHVQSDGIMSGMQISHLTKEARGMRRIVTIAVVTCIVLATIPFRTTA